MMIDRHRSLFIPFLFLLFISLLFGCVATSLPEPTSLPQPTQTITPEPIPATEDSNQPANELITLRLWVPPEFDPTNGSPAAELFAERLEEFENRKTNVRIETRVKAVEGVGGMIDILSTASAAAPIALPDLVALPQHALETAAIKGLLFPFDGLTDTMDDPDWYEFARKLSQVQDSTFGIPFSSDALIMVYRPAVFQEEPGDWTSLLELSTQASASLSFPASDPDSLLTLTYYQSIGGTLLDEENRPRLDSIQLTEVLTYYQKAEESMLMPFWLTQYETDEQSWTAYQENQTEMVVTWSNRYFQSLPVDSTAIPIPTREGNPYTLATGWAWALANPDPDHQILSAQLAEYITDSSFLGMWTSTGGYMPPRSGSLSSWNNSALQSIIRQVAPTAGLVPPLDVLTTIGPVLQKATIDVLKEEASPINAVETAIDSLTTP